MKTIYLVLAFLCVGLGAVGVVLPVLPTVPFLLAASFLFAKGSVRYHNWFIGTKLYQNHLKAFEESRSMTLRTKLAILLPVTAALVLAMILVGNLYMTVCLLGILAVKYAYFMFRIKTIPKQIHQADEATILSHRREH